MEINNAKLTHLSIHYIGNKANEGELVLSYHEMALNAFLAEKLCHYFLHKFPIDYEKYQFAHSDSIAFNEVYSYAKEAFKNDGDFHPISEKIAMQLFDSSTHPMIKAGELYVCKLKNIEIDGETVRAIGIFKTENKSPFFEINQQNRDFKIEFKEGVDLAKIDKGCLIFDIDADNGYKVCIVDKQNKGDEAVYWRENFLGLKQIANEFHSTKEFLNIAKSFVTKGLAEDFSVSKADKIDLLNRSVDYFKKNDSFDKVDFENEVFQNENVIQSFRNFDENFRIENSIDLSDSFEISNEAVKKQARIFKSVLKLDKNFHIYIHGDKQLIEKGTDPDGRKFYKIYYREEN